MRDLQKLHNVPLELRQAPFWLLWRYEEHNGKPTKVPYQCNGKYAKTNDPSTWTSFELVYKTLQRSPGLYSGLGFVFAKNNEYAGIDVDAIKEAVSEEKRQEIIARQVHIVNSFESYTEFSPSGKGVHIIIKVKDKGKLITGCRRDCVEAYAVDRYFAFTGNVYLDKQIVEQQYLAQILWAEMGGQGDELATYQGDAFEKYSDGEIISWALNATNGAKFSKLLDGHWQDLYPSQSEADFAFINIIAYYCDCRNQIVRLFRNSPLGKRKKAQRADYVEYMLKRAWDNRLPPIDIVKPAISFAEFAASFNGGAK